MARFFRTYYVPVNASLVIAGDIDIAATRKLVEKWFSDVPAGKPVPPLTAPTAVLDGVKKKTITDRVQLPRLYLGVAHAGAPEARRCGRWTSSRTCCRAGRTRASIKRLVYEMQIAQDVNAVAAVAGARQQLHDHRDGPAGPDRSTRSRR